MTTPPTTFAAGPSASSSTCRPFSPASAARATMQGDTVRRPGRLVMIFDIHASATTSGPLRSSPDFLRSAMAQYSPTVRTVGTDGLDAVLHVEGDRLADALTDAVNAVLDALHAAGDQVRAASVSGARDNGGSDEATDEDDEEDEEDEDRSR